MCILFLKITIYLHLGRRFVILKESLNIPPVPVFSIIRIYPFYIPLFELPYLYRATSTTCCSLVFLLVLRWLDMLGIESVSSKHVEIFVVEHWVPLQLSRTQLCLADSPASSLEMLKFELTQNLAEASKTVEMLKSMVCDKRLF